MSAASLRGWTPIWLGNSAAGPYIDWLHFGAERFTEPFFEQTVGQQMINPAQVLFRRRTPLTALEEFDRERPGLTPSGFIFHLSRCGSTLMGQMLAAVPSTVVISEAPPLDRMIFAAVHFHAVERVRRMAWLRGMVNALGQARHGERHFFLKLDTWHILELPLLMEAFPEVPWIFLYRDPLDVLISHERLRGSQMVPGLLPPQVFNFNPPWTPEDGIDAYTAWVLERTCRAALEHTGFRRGRLVHYRELPQVMESLCAGHFGVDFSDEDCARMNQVPQSHSKQPGIPFVDETAQRRREAAPGLTELSARWLAEPYAQLEERRAQQAPLPLRSNRA